MGENGNEASHAIGEAVDHESRTDVCRDYLKNICNRGSRCKFYHPPEIHHDPNNEEVKFCIDFQNRGCGRDNCRYVHAHRDDADRYKRSGEVTLSLARAIAAITGGDTINGIPFCKEFLTGNCSRGATRCRYWHINPEEERDRRRRMTERGANATNAASPQLSGQIPTPYHGYASGPSLRRSAIVDYDGGYEAKRGRYDDMMMTVGSQHYVNDLERKNVELTKENEGLRRELQRERERYEDLYALFRQQTSGIVQAPVSAIPPASSVAGAFPSAQSIYPATISMGSTQMPPASMQMSRAPTVGHTEVAVHWTAAGAPHWST